MCKSTREKKINSRYAKLLRTLDALEKSEYTGGLDTYWCISTMDWLKKWKKITQEEYDSLITRVMRLLGLIY